MRCFEDAALRSLGLRRGPQWGTRWTAEGTASEGWGTRLFDNSIQAREPKAAGADLEPRSGSEQRGRRPVIILSHDGFNKTPN